MFNRIRTGGECDVGDYVVLAVGLVLIAPPLTILRVLIGLLRR